MAKQRKTKGSALTYDEMDEAATQLDLLHDTIFFSSSKNITKDLTIPKDRNYMSIGPVTIADGVTVTLTDSADWTII
tara:strand:+ start:1381 stop:1611 length:231 start_codon:yes stop_codon:yes gene_type:complete